MHAIPMPQNPLQIAIFAGVVLLMLAIRMGRATRARPLKLEQLWIVPAIFTVIAGVVLWFSPPSPHDLPWLIGATLIGAVIGWYRGNMMRITVDPQTHALNQSASPAALVILVGILGLRYAARYALTEEAGAWGLSINLLTDAPLMLAVGMFIVARVEMYIRAQHLLAEARAAHTTTPVTSDPHAR